MERTLTLGNAGTLAGHLEGQWTSNALLAADQFAPAISGRVRGFDEIAGFGDTGASLGIEYQSPVIRAVRPGSLRGIAFLDSAIVRDRSTGENAELLSTGAGFRWQWRDLTASCDLGIPLNAPDGTDDSARLRLAVTTRW